MSPIRHPCTLFVKRQHHHLKHSYSTALGNGYGLRGFARQAPGGAPSPSAWTAALRLCPRPQGCFDVPVSLAPAQDGADSLPDSPCCLGTGAPDRRQDSKHVLTAYPVHRDVSQPRNGVTLKGLHPGHRVLAVTPALEVGLMRPLGDLPDVGVVACCCLARLSASGSPRTRTRRRLSIANSRAPARYH